MKQAIYSFAAILCLVTMLVSSSSCVAMTSHAKAPSTDCPSHTPENQPAPASTPVCCTVQHQPSASAAVFAVEQPVQILAAHVLPFVLDVVAIVPPPPQRSSPPPLPPLLKLRI